MKMILKIVLGLVLLVVIVEFESVEKAVAAHDSEGYQAGTSVPVRPWP